MRDGEFVVMDFDKSAHDYPVTVQFLPVAMLVSSDATPQLPVTVIVFVAVARPV